MADKNFKVKSGLNIPITSAAILTTDSSGNISSTNVLPITAGGTGQTSATNAINALLPVQNGSTVNYAIQSDGSNVNWGKLYNQTIKNNGTTVTPRGIVNIVGATFSDDSGTDTTTITFTDTTGVSKSGGDTITPATTSTIGLTLASPVGQTAHLLYASGGTRIPAGGNYLITPGLTVSYVSDFNAGAANITPIYVKGAASQTANLQEWQNSAGSVLTSISPTGKLTITNTSASAALLEINGSSSGQFVVSQTGGVITNGGLSSIGAPSYFGGYGGTGNVVVNVSGASGQTGDLQRWTNFSGTILAKVDSSGSMFTTTATAGTNTTQVATTAFVKTAIDNLIASAPGTLDTLDEIAQALNDDPNFYTTITTLTNALAEQDSYTLMGVF